MGKVQSSDPNKVTSEIIAANSQAVDILEVKKYDSTIVAKVDKDGNSTFINLIDKHIQADIAVYLDGANYVAKNCKTGAIVSTNTVRKTVYDAAIAALDDGCGTIIDFTGHTQKGSGIDTSFPSPLVDEPMHYAVNNYFDGVPYAPEYMLDTPFWLEPQEIISNFDGGAEVEWIAGSGIADDTDEDHIINGVQSLKVTIPASDGITAQWITFDKLLPANIDLRRCNFYVRAWSNRIDLYENPAKCGFEIVVADEDMYPGWWGTWAAGFLNCVNYTHEDADTTDEGWWEGYCDPCFANDSNAYYSVGVDWSRVRKVRFKCYSYHTEQVQVTLDVLQAYKNTLRRGTIVFSQDEGQYSWEYARAQFDKHNKRYSLSWESGNLKGGYATGYEYPMITDYLAKLARYKGIDIGAHGFEHVGMGGEPRGETARRYIRDFRAMDAYGMSAANKRTLISAGGSCGYEHGNTLRSYAYMNRGTLSTQMGFPQGALFCLPAVQDPSLSAAKAIVDKVAANCLLGNILVHIVAPTGGWTPAELDEFLTYCESKNVDVLDYTALVEMYLKSSKNKCRDWERWVTYDSL